MVTLFTHTYTYPHSHHGIMDLQVCSLLHYVGLFVCMSDC